MLEDKEAGIICLEVRNNLKLKWKIKKIAFKIVSKWDKVP